MIRIAGVFAVVAIAGLIGVSTWATGHVSIVPAIQDLIANPSAGYTPWLVATLFDAYFGFIWFWLWIAYKETRWSMRLLWLVLVLGLGNIAMGAYMLIRIARLPRGATVEDLLLRRA
ncbi:DUF1475 family protein [Sinimarinibacterium flocculans]|jgi:hypothetical protein|uniref:DUF1475 family protein n=1 Tax=Sinimarinibacterium flocculans TaxID=985250 RepID=UPI0035179DA1